MEDKWAHLGHHLGECWYGQGITYVHIPKNASSFIKGCLLGSHKFTHSDTLVKNNKYLVVLRDPIERWVSGMAQYEINSKLSDIPYEQITLDDHTERQVYFLQSVDLTKCDFIMVDDQLTNNLNLWFKAHNYKVDTNSLPTFNAGQEELKTKYQTIIDNDSDFMLKLKQHFADDYKLINRVKLYGNR